MGKYGQAGKKSNNDNEGALVGYVPTEKKKTKKNRSKKHKDSGTSDQ